MWTYFTDMFDFLTLSTVIDDQIFCVHGGELQRYWDYSTNFSYTTSLAGLSPSVHFIDQVKIIDRFRGACLSIHLKSTMLTTILSAEIPHEGPMADLVWSDPDPDKEEFAISPRCVTSSYLPNP